MRRTTDQLTKENIVESNVKLILYAIALLFVSRFAVAASNPVPLVSLISVADSYEGKVVKTIGWLGVYPKGTHPMARLYLTKEDLEFDNDSYEIKIDLTKERLDALSNLNKKMVIIEGTFKKSVYLSVAPSSAIINVSSVEEKKKWISLSAPVSKKSKVILPLNPPPPPAETSAPALPLENVKSSK